MSLNRVKDYAIIFIIQFYCFYRGHSAEQEINYALLSLGLFQG